MTFLCIMIITIILQILLSFSFHKHNRTKILIINNILIYNNIDSQYIYYICYIIVISINIFVYINFFFQISESHLRTVL